MNSPLAERMRPKRLADFIGQRHLVGDNGPLSEKSLTRYLPSIVFWGPPGTGKTTLAQLMAAQTGREFYSLSAISSGVREVREVIKKSTESDAPDSPILFIDEIHRFSKSQQDSMLGAVEKGEVVLVGATTENPSFEVISALLSRCQVYILESFEREDLEDLLSRAAKQDVELKQRNITFEETEALLRLSGGDARKLLNLFELIVCSEPEGPIIITDELVMKKAQQVTALYDKSGEQHYDIISAFIKSIRGGDPDATVYWLARMIEGGEDVKFIARRMLILASEDIGNANPTAMVIANNTFQAVNTIGYPEARIILSHCAIYLACSAKSNSTYKAINEAQQEVKRSGNLPVPLHLRNAPSKLMKTLGYGKDYKYGHNYKDNFVDQTYLPDVIKRKVFYQPGNNPRENAMREELTKRWKDKYRK